MSLVVPEHAAAIFLQMPRLLILDSVSSIRDHIQMHTINGECAPASIEMCVLSTKLLPWAWCLWLVDRELVGYNLSDDFFPHTAFDKVVFRLFVRRDVIHPERELNFPPGSLLFVEEVTSLKTFNNTCQGIADIDDFF